MYTPIFLYDHGEIEWRDLTTIGQMMAQRKIGDVEVLRGIAVSMVFVYHAQNMLYSPGSMARFLRIHSNLSAGVDLFFVISGFVITLDLLRSLESSDTTEKRLRSAAAFWTRRIFRILPSSWLWLGIYLLVATHFNTFRAAGTPDLNLRDAMSAIGQYANLHWYSCYAGFTKCGNNSIYWSLSLEEQFYLLLPLLFIFAPRRIAFVAIVAVAAQIALPRPQWSLPWVFRTDALCLGVLLALWSRTDSYKNCVPQWLSRNFAAWPVKGALALLVIAPGWTLIGPWTGMLAGLCAVTVWIASYDLSLLIPLGLTRRAILWIGERSFAIYLIHYVAICTVMEFANRYLPHDAVWSGSINVPMVFCAGLVTVALAEINFRYVETPFRRIGTKISRLIQLSGSTHTAIATDLNANQITK